MDNADNSTVATSADAAAVAARRSVPVRTGTFISIAVVIVLATGDMARVLRLQLRPAVRPQQQRTNHASLIASDETVSCRL